MNLVEGYVTEVIGEPFEKYGKWWVKVKYDCYGRISETDLILKSKESAENVSVGFKFLC